MAELKQYLRDFFFRPENEEKLLEDQDVHYCLDFIAWSMQQDNSWQLYQPGFKDFRDFLWSRWLTDCAPRYKATRGYFRDWIRAQTSQ